jgi:hypothetical protein
VSVDRSAAARSSTTAKIRSKEEKRGTRKDPSSGPGLTARTQITVPTVVQQWCSAPSSAADTSSSLEGGEDGGDDDDNIAYSAVVQALVPEEAASAPPSHSVFSHSLLHAGQTVSLTALHLPSLSALFVFLKSGDMASISKEWYVILLQLRSSEIF